MSGFSSRAFDTRIAAVCVIETPSSGDKGHKANTEKPKNTAEHRAIRAAAAKNGIKWKSIRRIGSTKRDSDVLCFVYLEIIKNAKALSNRAAERDVGGSELMAVAVSHPQSMPRIPSLPFNMLLHGISIKVFRFSRKGKKSD